MHTTRQHHEAVVKAVIVDGVKFTHPHHVRFVRSCWSGDFKPFVFEGRLCFVGPAIVVPELSDVARLGTDVPLAWDHLGKEYVVHPKVSANEIDDRRIEALRWHDRVTRGV